ncbi:M56 family metallopeptidase [Patiriisocius hiemis]|uniref:M56 family metallopeptidase n=1 Tax=Patiriisocius hiemis TaxID=3075604 RepID=A0ABU2YCM4_9FLAO|nr:M56 family metallopeptidase [Constantimarinum sp. W242]MDT0555937.1 M56 family metallopeptidase [Constantimarinum sp. W242]
MEILLYVLKSAGILALFYLVYNTILQRDVNFKANRHFLIGGVIAAITLPFLTFSYTTYIEALPLDDSAFVLIEQPIEEIKTSQEVVVIDWLIIAVTVYALGFLFMFIKIVVQLVSLFKLINTNKKIKKGRFTFVKIDDNTAPFSFFNYIVYNPKLHNSKELEMILAHEQIHARQWHSIDILLVHITRAIQWINPFSWLYKKSIETNLEYIADNETAQQVNSRKEYQLALVRASSSLPVPALTNNFYQSFLKKRIIMLNKSKSNPKNNWKLLIILPLLAIFLFSFNVKEVIEYIPSETISEIKSTSENKPTVEAPSVVLDIANGATVTPYKEMVSNSTSSEERKNTTVTEVIAKKPEKNSSLKKITAPTKVTINEIKFKVTKNTTNAELDKLKAQLKKEHDINMNYDVERNSKNEITSIHLEYDGNGKSGNYHINSDDNEGIDDFHFVMNDSGDVLLGNLEKIEKRFVERRRMLEGKRAEVSEKREKMKERRKEMNEERKVIREKYTTARAKVRESGRDGKKRKIAIVRSDDSNTDPYIIIDGDETEIEIEEISPNDIASVTVLKGKKADKKYGAKGKNGVIEIITKNSDHAIVIDKNTTDATLAKMKKNLAAKGVTFNYKRVKRNSNGEITGIKVDIKNGKGSKSSTSVSSDDGEPIETILLEID